MLIRLQQKIRQFSINRNNLKIRNEMIKKKVLSNLHNIKKYTQEKFQKLWNLSRKKNIVTKNTNKKMCFCYIKIKLLHKFWCASIISV